MSNIVIAIMTDSQLMSACTEGSAEASMPVPLSTDQSTVAPLWHSWVGASHNTCEEFNLCQGQCVEVERCCHWTLSKTNITQDVKVIRQSAVTTVMIHTTPSTEPRVQPAPLTQLFASVYI